MFEVGFSELLLIGLVALLVIGPERLPRVAREAALWLKKARSLVTSVKREIDHELQLDEMKQALLKHDPSGDLRATLEKTAREIAASKPKTRSSTKDLAVNERQSADQSPSHEEPQR